jgi:hypothetical protein
MTDIEAKTKSTPPLKAAWFEDEEHVENEMKTAEPSTSTASTSKEALKETEAASS